MLLLDMAYRLLREFRQAFTRLDTPPFSNRRHPGSDIAPIKGGWRGPHRDPIAGTGWVVQWLEAAVWAVSLTISFISAILLAAKLQAGC